MAQTQAIPTAADLRSEIGRKQVKAWRLAASLSMNPAMLSGYLTERLSMTPETALRIKRGIDNYGG